MFDVVKVIFGAIADFGCSLLGYSKDGVAKVVEIVSIIWFR